MSKKVFIVGLGNMGGGLVNGLLDQNIDNTFDLFLFDQHEDKRKKYESNRVTIVSEVSQFPEKVDYLVLCIKPHDVEKIALI